VLQHDAGRVRMVRGEGGGGWVGCSRGHSVRQARAAPAPAPQELIRDKRATAPPCRPTCSAMRYRMVDTLRSPPDCLLAVSCCSGSDSRNLTLRFGGVGGGGGGAWQS
jgi:hypothetical protein